MLSALMASHVTNNHHDTSMSRAGFRSTPILLLALNQYYQKAGHSALISHRHILIATI